jgi:hypothetical protein
MPDRKRVGNAVIIDTATFDVLHDVMDQVQRLDAKVSALCTAAGIDPDKAGRLPDDPPGNDAVG